MRRSATILFLALVLGAFVTANADDNKENNLDYDKEPKESKCHLKWPPKLYKTYGCPNCNRNDKCVETMCKDGKADVKIKLGCLFGNNIGFVAVSYKVGNVEYCVNNQMGNDYDDKIVLRDQDCYKLPYIKRFIVQNKWWWNKDGQDLDKSDICYDKCTKGKPCHTCTFDGVPVPECYNGCKPKPPMCPPKDKAHDYCPYYDNPYKCFRFDRYKDYVKVTLKDDCRKRSSHFFSYMKKDGDYYECADRMYSFDAKCNSYFNWYLEDDYYLNEDAKSPFPPGDVCSTKCYKPVCNQCKPSKPVHIPECKRAYP